MIPSEFTVYLKDNKYGKLAWDTKSAEKASRWGDNKVWDSVQSKWITSTTTKERLVNLPFTQLKVGTHNYNSKYSVCWVEPAGTNFQLEVETSDLLELIKSLGVNSGCLTGDFQWVVLNNKKVKVLDRNSQEYKDFINGLQVKGFRDTFSMSKLEIGGVYVEKLRATQAFVYCGKFNGLENKWSNDYMSQVINVLKKHVFLGMSIPSDPSKVLDCVVDSLKNKSTSIWLDAVSSSKQLRHHYGTIQDNLEPMLLKQKEEAIDTIVKTATSHAGLAVAKPTWYGSSRTFSPGEAINKYSMYNFAMSRSLPLKIPVSIQINLEDCFKLNNVSQKVSTLVEYTPGLEL